MAADSAYRKVLIGLVVGFGVALVLHPTAREKIKKLALEKFEDILPTIKEEVEGYIDRVSEAVALGKAASQQKEDELEQMIFRESQKAK